MASRIEVEHNPKAWLWPYRVVERYRYTGVTIRERRKRRLVDAQELAARWRAPARKSDWVKVENS